MITFPPISDHLSHGLMWEVWYKVKLDKEMSQNCWYLLGSKGWLTGESINLPPMWPEFNSRLRHLTYFVGWVCYWFSPLPQDVFLTTLAFPFPQKPMFDFQTPIQPGMVVGEPQCGCATSKFFFLYLFNSITIHNDNVLLWLLVCDIRHSLTVNLGCKLMPNHTYVTLYSIRRGKHFN